MPIPLAAPLIAAGSQAASSVLNAISTGVQNRKSRRFAEGMYERQKQDNIDFWRMQNEYNDPSNQRARLEAAGLNPALLYGSSSSGASGTAGSIQGAKALQPSFNPADFSGVGASGATAVNMMYDLEMKRQQTSNFERQNDVLAAEVLNKSAQTFKTLQEGKLGKLKYGQELKLNEISLEARREALRQMQVATDNMQSKELRSIEMHELDYKKGLEDIVYARIRNRLGSSQVNESKARIASLIRDSKIKDFEIALNKLGFSKSDPRYVRFLSTAAEGIVERLMQDIGRWSK